MKKIISLFILFQFMFAANAQYMVELYGGLHYGTFSNKSFTEFKNSYNAYYSTRGIVKELNTFKTGQGYQFGAIVNISPELGFSYSIFNYTGKSFAQFDIGKRHFDQKVIAPILIGFHIGGSKISFVTKLGIANTAITSYYEYEDGTISYGKDKTLNGIYKSWGFMTEFYFEYRVLQIDKLRTVLMVGGGFSKQYKFGFAQDWNDPRRFDIADDYPDGLPLDYEQYQNDVANFEIYKGEYTKAMMNSFNAYVQLRIGLGGSLKEEKE